MKCAEARRFFGAYWDEDTTQAEREWLESHFASCATCRDEYEGLARALEAAASLPRVEASPDFVERAVARAHRAATAIDRIPVRGLRWVPVTASAALLLIAAMLLLPWIGPRSRVANREAAVPRLREAELVRGAPAGMQNPVRSGGARQGTPPGGRLADIPDSLFNHSEDVEFILEPVTVRRGRATVTRAHPVPQGEQAVITF